MYEHRTMAHHMMIGTRTIADDQPAYVIAEIGINHNGDPELFRKLLHAIRDAGADAVKVQIVDAAKSYAKSSASYDIFKRVEFPPEVWRVLIAEAHALGLSIFSSFAHPGDVQLAIEFGFPAIKVSSSNVTNFPLLEVMANTGKPIIMSTGLSYLSEVDEAVRFLTAHGCVDLGILQCVSLYPTAPEEANLRTIATLRTAFPQYPIGFSDHTSGIACATAAVALGARVIEKHVTLDRSLPGPDHHFSATPDELRSLIAAIRDVEAALGSGMKQPAAREIPERKLQRVLVATRDIAPGDIFSLENLMPKRAGGKPGLAPRYAEHVFGQRASRAITADTPVVFADVQFAVPVPA